MNQPTSKDIQNINKIVNIIKDPVHGVEFYTREMVEELYEKVQSIISSFDIDSTSSQEQIIKIVNNFVKSTVTVRRNYFDALSGLTDFFDKSEEIYRTAYAALTRNEAMCAGYTEATRILLSMYDIDSFTVISKMPEEHKKLAHYICVAKTNSNSGTKYFVLDPEREANCEKKGKNYRDYAEAMTYCLPTKFIDYKDKVGPTGVGVPIDTYLQDPSIPRCVGTKSIGNIIKQLEDKGEMEHEEI